MRYHYRKAEGIERVEPNNYLEKTFAEYNKIPFRIRNFEILKFLIGEQCLLILGCPTRQR